MSSLWTKKKFFLFFPAVVAAACTPSFASASDVTDLRILAIQAEPPEAQFDATGAVQDVHLRVLAVDPSRGALASMDSSLCAPTDSRRCEGGPRFDLPRATRHSGTEFSATIPGALMSPLIAYAQSTDKLKGLGGIRVMYALSVDDGDPHGAQAADKILLYSPSGGAPNHNPQLTGVQLSRNGAAAGSLAPGETLHLPPGVQVGLRPVLAAGAQEEYDATDLRGNPVHLKEQATYAFFITPGAEIDRDTADEPVDGVAPPDGLSRVDSLNAGSGTLWIVVRDGRGGESWIAFPWTTS